MIRGRFTAAEYAYAIAVRLLLLPVAFERSTKASIIVFVERFRSPAKLSALYLIIFPPRQTSRRL